MIWLRGEAGLHGFFARLLSGLLSGLLAYLLPWSLLLDCLMQPTTIAFFVNWGHKHALFRQASQNSEAF